MPSELIVDFPSKRNHDVVRFAETAQLYAVDRHEDKSQLWYTKAEYDSMRGDIKRDVLQARACDSATDKCSGFWIGIAHLLTPACARPRCRLADVDVCEQFSQSKRDRTHVEVSGRKTLHLLRQPKQKSGC